MVRGLGINLFVCLVAACGWFNYQSLAEAYGPAASDGLRPV